MRRGARVAGLVLMAILAVNPGVRAAETTASGVLPPVEIDVPVALLGRPDCTAWVGGANWSMTTRSNGTKYGTINFTSSVVCDGNVVYLWVLGHLTKSPNTAIYRGSPGTCGRDQISATPTPGCRSVQMSGGSYYCDPCNGTYFIDTRWVIRFTGVLPGYTFEDSACTPKWGGKVVCTARHPQVIVI